MQTAEHLLTTPRNDEDILQNESLAC